MESISFRAWDKEEKKMHKVKTIEFSRRGARIIHLAEVNSNGKGDHKRWHSSVELMQSTGLKDDFGNELFEGDIFESRFSEIKYVVYWDDKLASFWIKGETKTHPLYTLTPFHPRILGNIYENPKLLEDN